MRCGGSTSDAICHNPMHVTLCNRWVIACDSSNAGIEIGHNALPQLQLNTIEHDCVTHSIALHLWTKVWTQLCQLSWPQVSSYSGEWSIVSTYLHYKSVTFLWLHHKIHTWLPFCIIRTFRIYWRPVTIVHQILFLVTLCASVNYGPNYRLKAD